MLLNLDYLNIKKSVCKGAYNFHLEDEDTVLLIEFSIQSAKTKKWFYKIKSLLKCLSCKLYTALNMVIHNITIPSPFKSTHKSHPTYATLSMMWVFLLAKTSFIQYNDRVVFVVLSFLLYHV